MRKQLLVLSLTCLTLASGAALPIHAAADSVTKKPLNEAFDQLVVVPYDYQNKLFVNGQLTDYMGDYQMANRNGRVLVPIRLMGNLATQASGYSSTWEAVWQPEHPNDVILKNSNLRKTVKFTVGSKTMLVNNEPQTMDVAPQKINGRIMLPLRSAAEALDKRIDWFDGLILIGDVAVDLKSQQTAAIKDQIKSILSDRRKSVDYQKAVNPLTKFGSSVYYYKRTYKDNTETQELYRKDDGKKETRIPLQGRVSFDYAKIIDNELYYLSNINNKTELDAFALGSNKTRKVSAIDEWNLGDGWVSDIRKIDQELYINLHYGDLTMGSETLYKVDHGALEEVSSAKNYINYVKAGNVLYQTDFHPMIEGTDNLYQIDLNTGKETRLGTKGFTYGVHRILTDTSASYGYNQSLYVQGGSLYVLGYLDSDVKDVSAVYKINLTDQSQVKLTGPAGDFWLSGNYIYYIDSVSGYLKRVDLNGGGSKTVVARKLLQLQLVNGSVYCTSGENVNKIAPIGKLYRYDIATGKEVKLSGNSVKSFYVGAAGIYFVSRGYDLGLYKVGANGQSTRLVKDSIDSAILTDAGMVYTLKYQEGIYSVK
ncbi:stalk domain-containing protein [Paenibacillus montanisoli]|uniref:Copper amine oxidase-like N-terminal domain-containing protein n=1 Tax=Paenibacillus montanisoli TaxID=2081970 RepID=A0A328TZR9_9BACL|nr:stalk domain-containing protein [Paenibacillus montanisoli]RAP75939.1 hypothetical protein DL346_10945 [Paenibacillus montanisoli]